MKNEQVIKDFMNGATSGHTPKRNIYMGGYGSTLRIDGDDLINYNTIIATRVGNTILLNNNKYSTTTSKIQSMIKRIALSSNKTLRIWTKGEII